MQNGAAIINFAVLLLTLHRFICSRTSVVCHHKRTDCLFNLLVVFLLVDRGARFLFMCIFDTHTSLA